MDESTAWTAKGHPEFVFTLDGHCDLPVKHFPSANAVPSASRLEKSPLLPITAMQPTKSSLLWLLLEERQSAMVVGGNEGVCGGRGFHLHGGRGGDC